jgi:hypothetical protein
MATAMDVTKLVVLKSKYPAITSSLVLTLYDHIYDE